MSLSVPNYRPPQFTAPLASVYCWVSTLTIDFSTQGGFFVVNVHPDSEAAAALLQTLDSFTVTLGQSLGGGRNYPTLAQLVAAAAARQQADPSLDPFAALRLAIYEALMTHPRLAGATEVP